MDGSGTFVTEGIIANPRVLSANEDSGSAIMEGHARQLARGAALVISSATPHWLRDVDRGIEFFAIKVH